MMRGDAAGHQVEAGVLKRQRLGVCKGRLEVGNPLRRRQLCRLIEHRLRQIARDHARHVRGKCQRGVAGAGGDVEGVPMLLRLHELDEAPKACTFGVHRRGDVGGRVGPKLVLNHGLVHGATSAGAPNYHNAKRAAHP
jgi:hypothetical protein